MTCRILLLHDAPAPTPEAGAIAAALRAQGAQVVALACAEPYDAVLDALLEADSVLYWR